MTETLITTMGSMSKLTGNPHRKEPKLVYSKIVDKSDQNFYTIYYLTFEILKS